MDIQLTALLQTFQFPEPKLLANWFHQRGVKTRIAMAPTVRGRYAMRRKHYHLVVDRDEAERLLPERYKELALIPPAPRFYTVVDAAAKMKITRQALEKMIREEKVDVLVDGYWMQCYLQRGNW